MPIVKHLVGVFAMPLPLGLLLALAGLGCQLRRRYRLSAALYIAAGCVVYLASVGVISNLLLGPLESRYPPLPEDASLPGVATIVVLAGSYRPGSAIPVTAALEPDGVVRLVEGVRLQRRLHVARLVLSGDPPEQGNSAAGYAELARDLGVSDAVMVRLPGSHDTREEALRVTQLLGNTPFILVTSAYHMPRAMKLFQRAGARPVAAPTGQLVGGGRLDWTLAVPSSNAVRRTDLALHEYLGLLAIKLGLD